MRSAGKSANSQTKARLAASKGLSARRNLRALVHSKGSAPVSSQMGAISASSYAWVSTARQRVRSGLAINPPKSRKDVTDGLDLTRGPNSMGAPLFVGALACLWRRRRRMPLRASGTRLPTIPEPLHLRRLHETCKTVSLRQRDGHTAPMPRLKYLHECRRDSAALRPLKFRDATE